GLSLNGWKTANLQPDASLLPNVVRQPQTFGPTNCANEEFYEMNQIATHQTYSMLVTEDDISKAMYVLSALPSRVQSDRKLFKEVYFRALHGVSRHSLEMAVQ